MIHGKPLLLRLASSQISNMVMIFVDLETTGLDVYHELSNELLHVYQMMINIFRVCFDPLFKLMTVY